MSKDIPLTDADMAIAEHYGLDGNVSYRMAHDADNVQSALPLHPVFAEPLYGHAYKARLRIELAHFVAGLAQHWMEVY